MRRIGKLPYLAPIPKNIKEYQKLVSDDTIKKVKAISTKIK